MNREQSEHVCVIEIVQVTLFLRYQFLWCIVVNPKKTMGRGVADV